MTPEAHKALDDPASASDVSFRAVFQVASVGMAILNTADLRLLDVNDKYCEITGYTREELLGKCVTDLMHPEDRQGVAQRQADALSGRASQHLTEKRYVRKDGAVVWVRVNSTYMGGASGQSFRSFVVVEDITERVAAQTALRESQRRLRALLDGMPDRVILRDAQGRIVATNIAQARSTGFATVKEVIGKTPFEFRSPEFARRVIAEDQEVLRTGTVMRIERQMPDGNWNEVIKAPIRDYSGELFGVVAIARDITERKRMENALRESEHRLREFLDGIPARAWFKDTQGRYIMMNNRQAQAHGQNAAALIGKTADVFLPADQARQVCEEDAQIVATGKTLRVERQSRRTGEWSEFVKAPVRNLEGTVIGIVGMVRDISIYKQVELALRDSEGKLRALLDAIPDSAWLKDTQGGYVAANRSAAEFFGLTPAQMAGKTAEDLFPPEEAKRISEEERQALIDLKPRSSERQVGGRWYETVKLPIRHADGAVAGLVAIARDVTERHHAEDELRAAKAAAEEANRAKGEFLSHMSHEMRTPMNAILGFAELALLEQPDPSQCEHLEKITAATKSLLRVIDDVLDFERVDAGKLELESLDFRIDDVLQNVRDVIERAANAKGLALRFTVGDDIPPRLKGDAARVTQVLMNLCANALKFTANGFIEVVVGADQFAEGAVTLRFEVRDTGIGMSAEEQARLFQPFMQADISTTRRYGGTGLGLAICKRLVELMGGRIWIESEPGEGTVVFFTIVCAAGESQAAANGALRDGLPAEAAMLEGKRVLVVDDHPINRMLMAKLLKLAGAQAVPAENGVEALRALESQGRVDLVLMDLRMPEMDGYEATRRIRADARWAKLPIVAVTASAATYERARCMAVGMNDVIVKPIHQSVFFPVVAAAMRAQAAAVEGR